MDKHLSEVSILYKLTNIKINRWIFLIILLFFISIYMVNKQKGQKGRTFIIGIDGAEIQIIQELVSQGKLPHFKYLMQNGAYGIHNAFDVDNSGIYSPIIWTSVATGMRSQNHGITKEYLFGKNDSYKGTNFFALSKDRKKPAIWNIFSSYHKKVAIVNWWGTYPAEKVNGFVVSNLITDFFLAIMKKTMDIKVLKGKEISEITYPESLLRNLSNFKTFFYKSFNNKEEIYILKKIRTSLEENDFTYDIGLEELKFPIKTLVNYCLNFDRDSFIYTKYFLEKHKELDLIAVYFQGIDSISHMFWCFRRPDLYKGLDEWLIKKYNNMVDDYYMYIDNYLGRIIPYINNNDLIIVCSDHGFKELDDYLVQIRSGNIRTGNHRPQGVVIICGKYIKRNFFLKKVSLLDILPTILYLNKIPLSYELEGRIIYECISSNFIENVKPRFIMHYKIDSKLSQPSINQYNYPFREEINKRLKALGYLN